MDPERFLLTRLVERYYPEAHVLAERELFFEEAYDLRNLLEHLKKSGVILKEISFNGSEFKMRFYLSDWGSWRDNN